MCRWKLKIDFVCASLISKKRLDLISFTLWLLIAWVILLVPYLDTNFHCEGQLCWACFLDEDSNPKVFDLPELVFV